MHVAAEDSLLFADDGILFSDWQATMQLLQPTQAFMIDRHAPGVRLGRVRIGLVQSQFFRRLFFAREVGFLAVLLDAAVTHQRTGRRWASPWSGSPGWRPACRCLRSCEWLTPLAIQGVALVRSWYMSKPAPVPDPPGATAPVTQKYGDGIVGMADLDPDRSGHLLAVEFEFDQVFGFDLHALGHGRTHQHRVVPGELVHRLGQFLQPAVVGELSVVDGGIAAEVDFDGLGVGGRSASGKPAALGADRLRRERSAFHPAIVQRFSPEGVEIGAGVLLLPVGLHDFVAARCRPAGEHGDQFVRALAVVERRDQRLHDAHRAVVGAGIAPGLQIVRFVHVPLAEFRGFVLIKPEMHAERNARTLERVGEAKIGGRIVGRIAAHDDQHVHLAGAHVGDQIFERLGLVHGIGVYRVGVENRFADIAQSLHSWRGQARARPAADGRRQ